MRTNRLEEAEQNYRRAVELFPEAARMHYFLGSVLQQQRKNDEALPVLEKTLKLDPKNVDAMSALAMIYDNRKVYSKSDSLYQEAIKLDPEDPLILNNYSYSLSVRDLKLESAKKMSMKAVAADSTNGAYLDTLGWIYFKLGNYEEALKYVTRAVEVRDSSAEVWEHLGDIYEKLNDLEAAKRNWKKALELEADRTWLQEKLNK